MNFKFDNKELEGFANTLKKALADSEVQFNNNIALLKKEGEGDKAESLKDLFLRAKTGKMSIDEFLNEAKKY